MFVNKSDVADDGMLAADDNSDMNLSNNDANVTDATTTGSSKTFRLELSLKSLVQKKGLIELLVQICRAHKH